MTLDAVLRQARPPSPLAGRLSAQSLLFALGEGTFMTGSAVFFTQIVGLSAAQVGLGLTFAGIAAFLAALPMGKLVDRFGPKKMWAVSATGQAAMFALWPFINGFQGYVTMAVGMEVIGALGGAAYGAYTIDVLPADERVKSRAYMYSALNVGFTLGSMLGASPWPSTPTTSCTRCLGSRPWSSSSTPSRSGDCRRRRTTSAAPRTGR
ncbi:MFS transporter [Phycicoccus sp. SLBN-51]|uniref:MFS transporter n=1 Tax=Phycicoccus sp. SLBN-51 TaxID=2768447 RepID=UPI001C92D3C7|nr:MFS transporter [Phycicoccus sp. SLBN-51]